MKIYITPLQGDYSGSSTNANTAEQEQCQRGAYSRAWDLGPVWVLLDVFVPGLFVLRTVRPIIVYVLRTVRPIIV